MAEALQSDFSFDKPIPGESLTAELGGRPWQNPPQYSTVDDALGYYIPRIAQDDFAKGLINVMKEGVPVTSLANVVMLSGVMEGKHSIDVGILAMPAIIETMKLIGDSAGVDYNTGMEKDPNAAVDGLSEMVAVRMMEQDDEEMPVSEPTLEEAPSIEETEERPTGLMSRRNNDGV